MRSLAWLYMPALSLAMIAAGCSKSDGRKEKTYAVKGTVVAVDPEKPSVKLDHEDIPGLLKGMVMDFDVASAEMLEGMKAGDKVQGKLKVESGKSVIIHLEKNRP